MEMESHDDKRSINDIVATEPALLQYREPTLKKALIILCRNLRTLHQLHHVHGRIEPSRVLYKDGQLYLRDFSLGYEKPEDYAAECDRRFLSPEILHKEQPTPASDVWGLGAILYYLISGDSLVSENNLHAHMLPIKEPTFEGECWRPVSADLKLLLREMLQAGGGLRNMSQVLAHRWMASSIEEMQDDWQLDVRHIQTEVRVEQKRKKWIEHLSQMHNEKAILTTILAFQTMTVPDMTFREFSQFLKQEQFDCGSEIEDETICGSSLLLEALGVHRFRKDEKLSYIHSFLPKYGTGEISLEAVQHLLQACADYIWSVIPQSTPAQQALPNGLLSDFQELIKICAELKAPNNEQLVPIDTKRLALLILQANVIRSDIAKQQKTFQNMLQDLQQAIGGAERTGALALDLERLLTIDMYKLFAFISDARYKAIQKRLKKSNDMTKRSEFQMNMISLAIPGSFRWDIDKMRKAVLGHLLGMKDPGKLSYTEFMSFLREFSINLSEPALRYCETAVKKIYSQQQ